MPLLDATPNTVNYLIAGNIFLLGAPIAYVITWFIRRRSLERDIQTLESLTADEQKRAASATPAPARPTETSAHQLP
jgi:HAMP domain-containing protein